MKRVAIYVEGSSDKLVLQTLFSSIIEEKSTKGIYLTFHESPLGDKKRTLLLRVPSDAADKLTIDPNLRIVVVPDLYPKNKGFEHETIDQLKTGIQKNCLNRLEQKGVKQSDIESILKRFNVFCFKHDLEVLLLASHEILLPYLNMSSIPKKNAWTVPVENQNHEFPPKRVVESLFSSKNRRYSETADAVSILSQTNLSNLAERCPQAFKPFVDFMQSL